MVKNIAVGSLNQTKVNAVKDVFKKEKFEIIGFEVPSGVSEQPLSDEETLKGAINRAKAALEVGKAEIGIGLEGGVMETESGMLLCNWGALYTSDNLLIKAGGARILLPQEVALGIKSGKELSTVIDEYTSKHDVRSNEGTIGIFTNGRLNRKEMFSHIMKLLLGQYEYYSQESTRRSTSSE